VRVADRQRRCIAYRLNILGVCVWKDHCQLIAQDRSGHWDPLGPPRRLPIVIPKDPRFSESDPLLLTAYQYAIERPGSDLAAVLAQKTCFEKALYGEDAYLPESAV
jgi:hypothetical protein